MKDFIFGTLATEDLRYKHVRNLRAGVSHYHRRTPIDPLPGQMISLELSIGPDHPCEEAWIYWSNDDGDPEGRKGKATHGFATPMEKVGVEWDTLLWGYVRNFRGQIPAQAARTVLRYYLSGIEPSGREILADQGTMYACYIDDDPLPEWTRDAIVYQVFVDRFNPGTGKDWLTPQTPAGFYGGALKGVTEKLNYLSELGVNVIWLTPIFPSPSHHGYDATDLFKVEPRLGTKADLQDLLNDAHHRGMRILLDLAPNHVSDQHPTFQAAIKDRNCAYTSWYTFTHWPDQYRSFFNVPTLPQLNLREPTARQYILNAASYWLDFGVDGYRVDYALGPAPDFWADFRRMTRKTRPDCWTFGEVVEPPDRQLSFVGGLDGCLDFNLTEAFRKTFAYGEWNAEQFASYLLRHEAFFPADFSRPSFLDNHDMNRFLWAAGGDIRRLKLAAMCQLTLSGAPVIYYGTEVGLSQVRDVRQDGKGLPEESRLPMLWGSAQNAELYRYYQRLIDLRSRYARFRNANTILLQANEEVLVYSKKSDGKVVVALNLSDVTQNVTLPGRIKEILIKTNEEDVLVETSGMNLSSLAGVIITLDREPRHSNS